MVLGLKKFGTSLQEIGNDSRNIGKSMEKLSILEGKGGTTTNEIDAPVDKTIETIGFEYIKVGKIGMVVLRDEMVLLTLTGRAIS